MFHAALFQLSMFRSLPLRSLMLRSALLHLIAVLVLGQWKVALGMPPASS
jgi:hypothetical protein